MVPDCRPREVEVSPSFVPPSAFRGVLLLTEFHLPLFITVAFPQGVAKLQTGKGDDAEWKWVQLQRNLPLTVLSPLSENSFWQKYLSEWCFVFQRKLLSVVESFLGRLKKKKSGLCFLML